MKSFLIWCALANLLALGMAAQWSFHEFQGGLTLVLPVFGSLVPMIWLARAMGATSTRR